MPPIGHLRGFSVSKNDLDPNEDRWRQSVDERNFAVCDGATVSFDSANWAKDLCNRYTTHPKVDRAWLESAASEYSKSYSRDNLSWSRQAAFDQGSFSSLVGISLAKEKDRGSILVIGDSSVFALDGDRLLTSLPYSDPAEFDQSPVLFSTRAAHNRYWTEGEIKKHRTSIDFRKISDPTVFLMTDALGRWFLDRAPIEAKKILFSIQSNSDFETFVKEERGTGRLLRDDTTLVMLGRQT
jgi:hypothetical protein